MALQGQAPAQVGKCAGVEDQFPEQSGEIDDSSFSGQGGAEAREEVEGPHGNAARHEDAVLSAGRNPHGAQGRNNPDTVFGVGGHHACGSEEQLVFPVGVTANDISMAEVP